VSARITNHIRLLRFMAGEMTQAELGKPLDEVFQWEG
jgi:hypothetical protein